MLALRREEVSAEKYSKDVVPLWHSVEVPIIPLLHWDTVLIMEQDSTKALLSIYPAGVEDLFPRRSNAINAASEMRPCLRYAFADPFSTLSFLSTVQLQHQNQRACRVRRSCRYPVISKQIG